MTGYVCSIGALQYLLGKYMYSHHGFTINPTHLLEALRGKINDKMYMHGTIAYNIYLLA